MSSLQGEALHVYLAKGGQLIDVNGLQTERDLIQKDRLTDCRGLPTCNLSNARTESCLRLSSTDDSREGVRNQWGLDLDTEFVAACRKRASQLISCRPEIYIPRD